MNKNQILFKFNDLKNRLSDQLPQFESAEIIKNESEWLMRFCGVPALWQEGHILTELEEMCFESNELHFFQQ